MKFQALSAAALLLALAAPAAASETARCEPIPGLNETVPLQRLDYLLIGETHGTTELPQAFAAVVCAALETGRPIVVGLEHTTDHQAALDAYMTSDGGATAREALLSASPWAHDTRFSLAMADLIEQMRVWRASGADVTIAAFDAPTDRPGTSDARERAMAQHLRKALAARTGGLAVALTGLAHGDRDGITFLTPPVASMIMHLPSDRTASLAFVRSGGESWRCARTEGAAEQVCGALPLAVREPAMPRGVFAAPDLPNFSGRYSPGVPLTASAPARTTETAQTSPAL